MHTPCRRQAQGLHAPVQQRSCLRLSTQERGRLVATTASARHSAAAQPTREQQRTRRVWPAQATTAKPSSAVLSRHAGHEQLHSTARAAIACTSRTRRYERARSPRCHLPSKTPLRSRVTHARDPRAGPELGSSIAGVSRLAVLLDRWCSKRVEGGRVVQLGRSLSLDDGDDGAPLPIHC